MNDLLLYAPALRACAIATRADVRSLSHIRVEPHNDRFRYVACDGHILLAVEAPGPLEVLLGLETAEHRLHIPADALGEIITSSRQMDALVDSEKYLVDPGFPQYRTLVAPFKEAEPSGGLCLGVAVSKKLNRIADALGAQAVKLQSVGEKQACSLQMQLGDVQAYGVVMPVATRGEWASPSVIASWFEVSDQAAS